MKVVLDKYCSPGVPLLMNDFQFIFGVYKALHNYTQIPENTNRKRETTLVGMCKQIKLIYAYYLSHMESVDDWIGSDVHTFLNIPSVKELNERYQFFDYDKIPIKTREQLLKYCSLDTYAMVKILQKLYEI